MKVPHKPIDDPKVTNELSILIKEKGFNERCYTSYPIPNEEKPVKIEIKKTIRPYNNSEHTHFISAPTFSQLSKWFRDIHNIHIEATPSSEGYTWFIYSTDGIIQASSLVDNYIQLRLWDNYEDCLMSGFKFGLTLI